jgi:uncharacterized protein (TIGR02246 family)
MKKAFATVVLSLAFSPFAIAADLQTELMSIEKTLWTAWGKKDGEPFKKMLTADAVEMVAGTAPTVGRDAIVKEITTLPCELRGFTHQDGKVRKLGKDVVILSYTATQDATCAGKKMPPRVYATSVYVLQKGKWMQTNYQETPLE